MITEHWKALTTHREGGGRDSADHVAGPGGAIGHAHVGVLHVGLAGSHFADGVVVTAIAGLREGAGTCVVKHTIVNK